MLWRGGLGTAVARGGRDRCGVNAYPGPFGAGGYPRERKR